MVKIAKYIEKKPKMMNKICKLPKGNRVFVQDSKVLEFIEFLEYDNIMFLSFVWEMLKVDIMKVDIETICNSKQNIIINEVEEQLETHDQAELISLFLRTYYKENFIKWFIRQSERSKAFIKLEILEREGKLNG